MSCAAPRSLASSASRCSSCSSTSLDLRIRSAVCLFEVCERSFWHWTTIPVGRCVMRTAESVLLTCWPPAPGGAVGVDPQVVLVDLDGALLGQERRDDGLRESRVAAVGAVERAQADEPVHTALGLEEAVGVLALRGERRRLQSGLLPRARLDELRLEAAILGPAEVHPQQHLRPVLSVGAAGARMDGDDGVAGVVLPLKSASSCSRSSSRRSGCSWDSMSAARSGSSSSSSAASSCSRCSRS